MFAFILYNDFAGYSDIVRGVSGLFGIELSINFRTPYFSRTFTEFWSRWHISFSEWLRDYIFYPISRALIRYNPIWPKLTNLVLPPLITMFVSSLWHGFGPHLLVWGGLHGLYQIAERIPSLWGKGIPPHDLPKWRQGLAMGFVFTFVILAWVPFRWELPIAFTMWEALLDWSSVAIRYRRFIFVAPIILLSLLVDFLQYRSQEEFVFLKWPSTAQAACVAAIFVLIYLITGENFEHPFIYQSF
jgi:D-alanyl-lipoteichoic acid acyltransferase DltB (MBOAT superfamily)